MKGKSIIGAVILIFIGGGSSQPSLTRPSVEGVWNIVEVQTVRADGQVTSVQPRESIALFAQGHYSFCWTSHKSLTRTWQIADSERVARFNQSLINAGTYTLSDSLLIMHASFALSPKFIAGTATFRYMLSGDTLTLTGVSVLSADGVLHPTYASGAHGVNKLVKAK
jgi:hypothetical protein